MLSNTILDLLKLAFQFSYRVYSGVMGTVLFSVTELLWKLAILLCSASVQSMMKKMPASFLHEW